MWGDAKRSSKLKKNGWKKCQNHVWNYLCLKDFTTGLKISRIWSSHTHSSKIITLHFFYHTLSIVLISRPEAWLVLRFSYHILLISLCPAHQFSRKLLAMSICNLVSTKCYYCYHQFMEGLWQKKSCHAFKHLHHFQRLLNVGLTNAQNLQLELSRFSYTFYFRYPKILKRILIVCKVERKII